MVEAADSRHTPTLLIPARPWSGLQFRRLPGLGHGTGTEASRGQYAPGTAFAIDGLTLVGNTGTYLDAPDHRYPAGADLGAVPLARTADLEAVVVRVTGAGQPGIDTGALAALDARRRSGPARV